MPGKVDATTERSSVTRMCETRSGPTVVGGSIIHELVDALSIFYIFGA